MNTNLNSAENFNELVFENKNKAYGAYALRKSYKDHMTISLVLSSSFFGLLALLAVVFTNKKTDLIDITGINEPIITTIMRDIIIPETVKTPDKIEKTAAAPKTTTGQMKASDDKKDVVDKINDQKIISKVENPKGADSTAKDPDIKLPVTPVVVAKPPVERFAEQMPHMDNMAKFFQDHLNYPRAAKENGTKGIVYVTFVVEMDGSITDIKLLKGIGDGCEQEAIRVVNLFPKWIPGMSNGKALRVQCNLPVSFQLK